MKTIEHAEQAVLLLKVKGQPSAKWYRCPDVSVGQIISAAQRDDYTGICVLCGGEQGGCEPDARAYWCEGCGGNGVYGAEELIIRLHNA
uniref:Uncharacterized protein n=1 Tax=viral metagenome TaxID=1070528 RepID=A0A6M3LTN7_9ZZZZ